MLLEPPLETHQLQNAMLPAAQAYDLVFEVRKTCSPTAFGCEDVAKPAALAVREVLVLQICCSSVSMNDAAFEISLKRSFGRQLESELRSQLIDLLTGWVPVALRPGRAEDLLRAAQSR